MEHDVNVLLRRIDRERKARKQAERILEEKANELYNANQELITLNASLEDQVKERTAALARSESQYRGLIESAREIIFNVDLEGYVLYVNDYGARLLGYTPADIVGCHFSDFIPEKHRDDLVDYYAAVRDEAQIKDYSEFPMLTKSGDIIWVGQNISRVSVEDTAPFYAAVARNISKRKEAEQKLEKALDALQKSEVKYRSILENMDLGLLEVDTEGIIIRVYDAFCEMTGYTADELVGKNAKEVLLPEVYYEINEQEDANRLEGKTGVYEIELIKKNGERIWVIIGGAPFYDERGAIAGSMGIHYNITERKNLEADLRAAEQKATRAQQAEKQFLASMSHEIRTPLNAIIGMTHLLKDTQLDHEQAEYLKILDSSSSILIHLISDILDMSKIDAGAIDLQYVSFNLLELLRDILNTFKVKSDNKNLTFVLDVNLPTPCVVTTDRQLLSQVLINLISNAEKFTSDGHVKLSAALLRQDPDQYTVRFAVDDTGIGIAPGDLTIIFEQFKQASKQIREKYGGTGLGLAISKKVISLLGGDLHVESAVDEGSRFYFDLTLDRTTEEQSESATHFSVGTQLVEKSLQVLVVEDNQMNIKYISTLLEKWNYTFDIAKDGIEALHLVDENNYDIIFMDLQMPHMDGFQATRAIRAREDYKKDTKIIALTASTFLSKKHLALQEGMTDFLSKPFTPTQLAEMLKKHTYVGPLLQKRTRVQSTSDIDWNHIRSLYDNDMEHVRDMFDTFLETHLSELEQLKEAITARDQDKILKTLHRVKPIYAMVGLQQITSDLTQLEQDVKQHGIHLNGLEQFIDKSDDLLEMIRQSRSEINKYLK